MATSDTASTLNGLFKAAYSSRNSNLMPTYTLVVHPETYKKLMEESMYDNGQLGTVCVEKEEAPLQRELNNRKYQVRELRAVIARKQEELRIALALLAAVKKLDKGGK